MTSTEQDRVDQLAGALFDQVVVPLAEARRAARAPEYFPVTRDPEATSYFVRPGLAAMRPRDFDFPGGGTPDGLINELANFWKEAGETALAGMSPRFREIASALAECSEDGDGSVDILCYTMF